MKWNPEFNLLDPKIEAWEIAVEINGPFPTATEVHDLIDACPARWHPLYHFLAGLSHGMAVATL